MNSSYEGPIFRATDGTYWRWNPFRSDFNQHFPPNKERGCGHIDCVNECGGDFTHATCPAANREPVPAPPEHSDGGKC